METMLLFATIFVPIALVVVFVGGVSYYNGYAKGTERAFEEMQSMLDKFIEVNILVMEKHFGEGGEDEKDNV